MFAGLTTTRDDDRSSLPSPPFERDAELALGAARLGAVTVAVFSLQAASANGRSSSIRFM
jgi:hypothetical protein